MKILTFWLFSSSETETLQQLLHAPSCCLLVLSLLLKLSLLQLLPLSLSHCLSMLLALSLHTGSSVGENRGREGFQHTAFPFV